MSVEVERDGPVTIVTIDRPEARNAVDPATAAGLREAFDAFDADEGADVAVLTGAGGHFCARLRSQGAGRRRRGLRPGGRGADGADPAAARPSR